MKRRNLNEFNFYKKRKNNKILSGFFDSCFDCLFDIHSIYIGKHWVL